MKYYVDIVYMIVNGVIILNDKNKNMLDKKIIKASGLSNVKKANGLKSVKGGALKILS